MSLEKKIKTWENDLPRVFDSVKDNLGKKSFFLNLKHGGKCYKQEDKHEFKYQKCNECKYLYHNLNFLKKDGVITIPTGKKKGVKMIIKCETGDGKYNDRLDLKDINNLIGRKIHQFYKDEFFCISNINWYTTKNSLVNLAFIMMIIKLYSNRKNFQLYLPFHYTYQCGSTNFLIYDEMEYESIDKFHKNPAYNISYSPLAQKRVTPNFTKEAVKDILFQVTLSLKFYSNLYFTHNYLDYTYLKFSNSVYHVQLQKEYIFPFKCVILPSQYSSICIYDSKKDWWGRFNYSEISPSVNNFEKLPFEDFIIEMNGTQNYYNDTYEYLPKKEAEYYMKYRIYFYRIKDMSHYFIRMRRYYGSVWGLNSFDIVCLFSSLMTVKYFSNTVTEDEHLKRVWLGLWRRDEAHQITDLLVKQKRPLLFDDVYKILKKFYIRFDALNYLYEELS